MANIGYFIPKIHISKVPSVLSFFLFQGNFKDFLTYKSYFTVPNEIVWNDVDNWKNITNSQNSVRKKVFSNCHIIGLDTGSLVLIVFVRAL
jgi:hypothetical protein